MQYEICQQLKQRAVIIVQKAVRRFLQKRRKQREMVAVKKIQTQWRGYRARKMMHQLKWKRDNEKKMAAAAVIKVLFFDFLLL